MTFSATRFNSLNFVVLVFCSLPFFQFHCLCLVCASLPLIFSVAQVNQYSDINFDTMRSEVRKSSDKECLFSFDLCELTQSASIPLTSGQRQHMHTCVCTAQTLIISLLNQVIYIRFSRAIDHAIIKSLEERQNEKYRVICEIDVYIRLNSVWSIFCAVLRKNKRKVGRAKAGEKKKKNPKRKLPVICSVKKKKWGKNRSKHTHAFLWNAYNYPQ